MHYTGSTPGPGMDGDKTVDVNGLPPQRLMLMLLLFGLHLALRSDCIPGLPHTPGYPRSGPHDD